MILGSKTMSFACLILPDMFKLSQAKDDPRRAVMATISSGTVILLGILEAVLMQETVQDGCATITF